MVKRASTSIPVHEFIAERWSPRSFDPAATIDDSEVIAMLEAARWAPSSMNGQPWRFAVARRGSDRFESLITSLNPGNAAWAHRASALIVAAAHMTTAEGRPNRSAVYDLGLAVSLLTVQAHAMNLHVHQMGGFDREQVREMYHLPADVEPIVVLAIGTVAAPEQLAGPLLEREMSPRERLALEDIVIDGLE